MWKKIIHIFLDLSIEEFKDERVPIENFIRNVSDKFEEHYQIKLQPLLSENFDNTVEDSRTQEEYNEIIRGSEFCFFIFFKKIGEHSNEEFEVAYKQFMDSDKPKIYSFFKEVKDGEAQQGVYDFMNELDRKLGHYYSSFTHIDTIKLRILMNLKLQEMDFVEIKVDNGKCVVDGVPVMTLENVSEFFNNENLTALQEELKKIEEEYYQLKPLYEKKSGDAEFYKHYCEIATKRQSHIDEIEEIQKQIFKLSMKMVSDEIHGEITVRQKEAYRLFESGDYNGCMSVLDTKEMDNELSKNEKKSAEEKRKSRIINIKEYKTRIEALQFMKNHGNRFDEITECYEKIAPLALEEKSELDTVYDYASFLDDQNKSDKALKIAMELEKCYQSTEIEDDEKAALFNLIGMVCHNKTDHSSEAEDYYLRALEIWEALANKNPDRFNLDLANTCNCLSNFYSDQGQPQKAEEFYLKALKIWEALAKKNSDRFNPDLAMTCNNLGVFYKGQGQPQKAEEFYLKALKILEALTNENPNRFNPDLAGTCNNLGIFYKEQGQPQKAEEFYLKALNIYKSLANENPDRFNPDLGNICKNIGSFYYEQGQPKKADEFYLKALKLWEELAVKNPDRFNPDLGDICNNIGIFYSDQGQPEKAEEFYLRALNLYEEHAVKNTDRFNPYLATICNNIGNFYSDQGQPKKAEEYYLRALKIREELAVKNTDRFNPDLATTCNNLGNFYHKQRQTEKAKKYYLRALKLREELANKNPNRFNSDLATTCNCLGAFYSKQRQPEKAEEFYLKALKIWEELANKNPDRFNHYLAIICNNIGIFYNDQGQPEKAEEFYLKALKIWEELAKKNPNRFNSDLGDICNILGVFYKAQGQPEEAEKYYLKALLIREELAKKKPYEFNPHLATTCNNLGSFYIKRGLPNKAEEFYLRSLKIWEELAKKKTDKFNMQLAIAYHTFGVFYVDTGRPNKAEEHFLSALKIWEELAKKNPYEFNPNLVAACENLGNFYMKRGQPNKSETFYKAEKYYLRALKILEELANENPDKFNPDLALSHFNYSLWLLALGEKDDSDEHKMKALELAITTSENPISKQLLSFLKSDDYCNNIICSFESIKRFLCWITNALRGQNQ